jgi:hypothetical protein
MDALAKHEEQMFNKDNDATLRSTHGAAGQFIVPRTPDKSEQDHADYQQLMDLTEAYKTHPPVLPKNRDKAVSDMKALDNKIKRETAAANRQNKIDWQNKERAQLQQIEGKGYSEADLGTINSTISTAMTDSAADIQKAKDGNDPVARIKAERLEAAGPAATFAKNPATFNNIAINIKALNPHLNLSAATAAQLAGVLVTPPMPGDKSPNGYRGRAAANYLPAGHDMIGNRGIQTMYGYIRVSPTIYTAINDARIAGYNGLMKYEADLAKKRKEQAEPSWFGRNVIDPLVNMPITRDTESLSGSAPYPGQDR